MFDCNEDLTLKLKGLFVKVPYGKSKESGAHRLSVKLEADESRPGFSGFWWVENHSKGGGKPTKKT